MVFSTKSIRNYIISTVIIVFMFAVVIELVTRTISWMSGDGFTLALHELDPYDQAIINSYEWYPYTVFTMRRNIVLVGGYPNQKARSTVFTDGNGFLIDKTPIKLNKEKNEIRIATIGASTTANLNLAYNQNWPGKLGSYLQKRLPQKKITIINAAVPGFDTAQSVSNLALRVMPFKPDVVIIYHAYNDLKVIRPTVKFRHDYSHMHTRPYGYYEKPIFIIRVLNHSMFYVRIRNKYRRYAQRKIHLDSLQQRLRQIPKEAEDSFRRHIRTMISIARSGGAKVVLSSFATLHDPYLKYDNRGIVEKFSRHKKVELYGLIHFLPGLSLEAIFSGIKRYNKSLKEIAKKERTGWVDNAKLIPHEDKYFIDRVHFTHDGAALMARNFLPEVIRQLKRKNAF